MRGATLATLIGFVLCWWVHPTKAQLLVPKERTRHNCHNTWYECPLSLYLFLPTCAFIGYLADAHPQATVIAILTVLFLLGVFYVYSRASRGF